MMSCLQRRFLLPALAVFMATSWTQRSSAQSAYAVTTINPTDPKMIVGQPPNHQVTLTVHDSTIKYVVNELARQAHFKMMYVNASVLNKRTSIHVTDMDVLSALAVVLRGTGLEASMAQDGETIMLRPSAPASSGAQPRADGGTVSGTVTDSATSKPIEGASVSVHGTKLATTTSVKGTFTLAGVPTGEQVLEIRAFGYKPLVRTVEVTDSTPRTLHLMMAQALTMLSGVVTTATGLQQKLAVGSDITTINVDSVMKTAPINTVTDLLENRVPGLTVVHTSGTPGDPSRLRLRGAASIMESNNPILVIDGVRAYYPTNEANAITNAGVEANSTLDTPRPSPLDQLDPNMIETIEVLKGPSASALYGSDAANGVIVITTKKGQPGQTRWSVSAEQGISYIPGSYPTLTYQYGQTFNSDAINVCAGGLSSNGTSQCYGDSLYTFQALNDPQYTPLTSGPLSTVSATVSGGNQALSYSFTGSWADTHGMTKLPNASLQQYEQLVGSAPPAWMVHPDDYKIWNVSSQLAVNFTPVASVTVHNMLSSSTQQRSSLGLSAVQQLIGTVIDTTALYTSTLLTGFETQIPQTTQQTMTDATLQWRVRPWLPLAVTAGIQQNTEVDKQIQVPGLPSALRSNFFDSTGAYAVGRESATMATLNANTTIPISLLRGYGLRIALGTNFVDQSESDQQISTSYVPLGVSDPTNFLSSATNASQTTLSSATYGWFMEPQLMLGSNFFLTPGIRLDGGTASGSGAGFTAFPKVNASYVAMDHSTITTPSTWDNLVTLLRVRGAFGIAGVQPTPGQSLRLFAPTTVSLDGGTVGSGANILSTIGNTTLHPERSREIEAGFDAQLLQNRVTLTATYYDKVRFDAIQDFPVAPSVSGYGLPATTYLNIGNIRNTGLEFTATAQLIQERTLAWSVNGSISTNANRVLSVNAGMGTDCNSRFIVPARGGSFPTLTDCIRKGYPLDGVWAPPLIGYADVNGDGMIELDELQYGDSLIYLGDQDPRYTASFSTTMSFWNNRLSVSASGDYQNGLLQQNALVSAEIASAADVPGATLLQKALVGAANTAYGFGSYEFQYQTVNLLRVDALSVTITLPSVVAQAFRSHLATLSLQGSNLLLISNYQGKDPSVGAFPDGENVMDTGQLPLPRTWRLAVRISQ